MKPNLYRVVRKVDFNSSNINLRISTFSEKEVLLILLRQPTCTTSTLENSDLELPRQKILTYNFAVNSVLRLPPWKSPIYQNAKTKDDILLLKTRANTRV